VSVADVTTPGGSPTFEISRNGGAWKLASLRIATGADFVAARFDGANELTVGGDSGIYLVKSGNTVALLKANDAVGAIQTKLRAIVPAATPTPTLTVAAPFFRIEAKGSVTTLPAIEVATATQLSRSTTYDVTDHDLTIVGSKPFVISDGIGHYAALPSTATAADIRSVLAGFAGPGAGTVSVQTAFDLSAAGTLTPLPALAKVAVLNAASFDAPNDLRVTGSTGAIVLTDGADHALLPLPTSPAAITTALEKFGRIGAGRVTVGQTYEISASAPLPAMQILKPADLTAATLVRQSAATRRLTLAADSGFFVISDGADFAVVPVTGTTATLKNAIRSALEGFDRIGAHVSVADVTTPGGSPTFEISTNGGSWKLPSQRACPQLPFQLVRIALSSMAAPKMPYKKGIVHATIGRRCAISSIM
jgi:hypothetical protein